MLAVLLLMLVVAVVPSWAHCPHMKVLPFLDVKKFMGTWYQFASFGTGIIKSRDRCVQSTYTLGHGGVVTMENDRIARGSSQHFRSTYNASSDSSGTLKVTLNLFGGTLKSVVPLLVLGTDYNHYAVLYACKTEAPFKFNSGYIFTRKRCESPEELASVMVDVDDVLAKNLLYKSSFTVTDQANCACA